MTILTIFGYGSIELYQDLIRSISYTNVALEPSKDDPRKTITVSQL